MAGLPIGTVTFLFTDIESSTRLLQLLGARYADVLEQHRRLLRDAFERAGGREISNHGDEFFVAFSRAKDALAAAIEAQLAMAGHSWPASSRVHVRMAIHTGEPHLVERDYVGIDVHRASRICAAGHGGQILLSQTTHDLIARDLPNGVTLTDLGAHRLKDLATEHLYQVAAPGLPAEFPPLKSLNVLPNNLPRQLTSFIGRERQIAELEKTLSSAHLVTLMGVGGCGKTRLALQVAAEVLAGYRDGVWLVELAALSDPSLVAKEVARVLGVREDPDRTPIETVAEFAESRQLLLVLDNAEHLVAACAELAEIMLRKSPDVRILVTSREPLRIPGEIVKQVPPLSLPEHSGPPSVDRLMASEAARLLAERATLNLPQFALSATNAGAVARICARLDGIPLAIELAAARVDVLAPEQIVDRLDDRFRFLTGGGRRSLPRHQTLRAAMDWSYDLLSENEKVVLRRLSIFSNGWTLGAAETICGQDPIRPAEFLDLLAGLVHKSLVTVETGGGEARYRQLETVRQYGSERLLESGEAVDIATYHRDWYMRFAEQAAPELVGEKQAAWFQRLETELDNLRAALSWSIDRHDEEAGLRLAGAIWQFWLARGYFAEGRRWLETLLQNGGSVSGPVRAQALFGAGALAVQGQGDYGPGRAFYEESLALWRGIGDKRRIADVLNGLGVLAGALGDQTTARARHEESLAIRRELDDPWGIGVSLHNLGRVAYREARYDAAQKLFKESLALWRQSGDQRRVAMALTNFGFATIQLADYEPARTALLEALTIIRQLGDKWQSGYSLEAFACLAAAEGRHVRAARLFGATETVREAINFRLSPIDRKDLDHWSQTARRALGGEAFAAAVRQGRELSEADALAEAEQVSAGRPERPARAP